MIWIDDDKTDVDSEEDEEFIDIDKIDLEFDFLNNQYKKSVEAETDAVENA